MERDGLPDIDRVTLGFKAVMILLGAVVPRFHQSSVARPRSFASPGSGVIDW
jgi:hypothetical protein